MQVVVFILNAAKVLVFVDAITSWFLRPGAFPRSVTKPLLDPLYDPIRDATRPITGSLDLSPLLALGALFLIEHLLTRRKHGPR
jgi:uncharacterized protein YggT (Ycf19 family)